VEGLKAFSCPPIKIMQSLSGQVVELFILAIPIASVAWTVTHEELFREPRQWCTERSRACQRLLQRKFFYLFTCEYCFSHYVTLFFLLITGFKLFFDDWRGYVVAGLSLVWVANLYISLFGRIRLDIKSERIEIETKEIAREQSDGDETTLQRSSEPSRSGP
jgi:hypothetical protein